MSSPEGAMLAGTLSREVLAKPPGAVPDGMLSPEGLAKPPGAVPSAESPSPRGCRARCAQWARKKCCSFFLFRRRSCNLIRRHSRSVLAATGTPLEPRRNKILERHRNKNFKTSRHHPPGSVHRRGCRRGMQCGKLGPHHPRTLAPHPRPYGNPRPLCRLPHPQLHSQINP